MATMSYYPNYQIYSYPPFNGHFQPAQGYVYGHGGPQEAWRPQQARSMLIHQANSQRTTETKPRLAKEEVEQLEAEFQKNHKPNTSVKKGLAEQMRVDIARINNWFQNRRAKAKHEARQKQDQEQSEPASPAQSSEKDLSAPEDHADEAIPAAAFSYCEQSPHLEASVPPTIDALNQPLDTIKVEDVSDYASPESMRFHNTEQHYNFAAAQSNFFPRQACDFQDMVASHHPEANHGTPSHLSIGLPLDLATSIQEQTESLEAFVPLDLIADGLNGAMAAFPSQLLPASANTVEIKMEEQQPQDECDEMGYQQFSPESTHSPAMTPDLALRAPPAVVDLASRRNMRRPPPLVANSLRTCSYAGPKTGIDMPKRSEAASPMRRIASAGVGMPGRITKPVTAAPRSPMYLDKRPEAFLQLARSPVMGAPPQSAAPPTPITPIVAQQSLREATVSSTSSEDESKTYTYQTAQFVMDPSIRTPPTTPSLLAGFPKAMFPNTLDASYHFSVADEPLATPVLGAFGVETEFPSMPASVPSYIANAAASQPSTPGFAPTTMGPTYFAIYPGSNQEYNWSEAPSARSSPGSQSRPRQLQFTNITPQDFQR